MAGQNLTAEKCKHFTTSGGAGNADTVTLTEDRQQVTVVNLATSSGKANAVYVRADGTAPTIGGDDSYVVPAGMAMTLGGGGVSGATVVKVISTNAVDCSVEVD